MAKRTSYEIKQKILAILKEKPLTYAELERKVNTGFRSIIANCKEMEDYGQIEIETINKHPANGREAHLVKITKNGLEVQKKKKSS